MVLKMAQKLYIPNINSLMILSEDWTFKLYWERRNSKFFEALGWKITNWWRDDQPQQTREDAPKIQVEKAFTEQQLKDSYKSYSATNSRDQNYVLVTLPKGTQLKVDRIYIKRNAEAFSSLTFRTTKVCPDPKFKSKRFWAKLRDVNNLVVDVIG